MKIIFLIFFILEFLLFNISALSQNNSINHESCIYEVANSFIDTANIKRIRLRPVRYIYSSNNCEWKDTCDLNLISNFLNRVIVEAEELNCQIDSNDRNFMVEQIKNPKIEKYSKSKIKKAKIKRKQNWIIVTNPISVPLFTTDFNFAVITVNDYGMYRTYLFNRKNGTDQWIQVGLLWQDGS